MENAEWLKQENERLMKQLADLLEKKARNPQRVAKDPLDRYYTPAWVTEILVENWPFPIPIWNVWEPCAGAGDMSRILADESDFEMGEGLTVWSTDIHWQDVDDIYITEFDFLQGTTDRLRVMHPSLVERLKRGHVAIVTNPPYSIPGATAADFVRKALEYTPYVAMLLRQPWVEACEDRKSIFAEQPPAEIWAISPRVNYSGPNTGKKQNVNSISCWYIWKPGTEKTLFKWVEGKP